MRILRNITKSALVGSAAFLGLIALGMPAFATPCTSTSNCTLDFTTANTSSGIGTGNFGSVTLTLNADNTISVDISLASGFGIINTGFPNGPGTNYAVGFSDSLGGGLTVSNFNPNTYSGYASHSTQDLQFDGFGDVNNAAGTTSLCNTCGSQTLSFDVSAPNEPNGFSDVSQLVNLSTGGGSGQSYFIVDVFDANAGTNGSTGLIGTVSTGGGGGGGGGTVPEPSSLLLFGSGLIGLGALAWDKRRRRKATV